MAIKTKSDRGPAGTLTVDDLTRAIKNSIDRTGMKEEEARAMAQHVLNFFGYSERIIDNVLEPEDRDAFYMLEDSGILTTEREETTLYDGREWRIHYWMFRKERIAELVEAQKAKEEAEKMGSIYDDIPEDSWATATRYPDGSFDRVTAVVSFHHMEDPDRVLTEVHRVLRAGGRFVLMELPPSRAPSTLFHWFAARRGEHLSFSNPDELAQKLEVHGFRDVSIRQGSRGFFAAGTR